MYTYISTYLSYYLSISLSGERKGAWQNKYRNILMLPFLEVEENTFSEALELSGTPFPYFPEMMPQASGDHVIAPTPIEEKKP